MLIQKILVVFGILYLPVVVVATSDCLSEPNATLPTYKETPDEKVRWECQGYPCKGKFIFEQLNTATQQYEVIQEGSHRIKVTTPGIYRCRKSCDNGDQSSYCYVRVEDKSVRVQLKMDLPLAKLHNNYTATCTAISHKPEEVEMTVDNEDCHCNTEVDDIDEYTRKVTLTIEPFTVECSDVVVKCKAYDTVEEMRLEVTEESHTTVPIPPTTEGPDNTPSNSTVNPGRHVGSGASTVRHKHLLMFTIIVTVLWIIT